MIDAEDMIGGEYYVSLPFNYLVKDGLKYGVHQIQNFLSVGHT